LAIWLGLTLAQRRMERAALDVLTGQRLGGWMVAGGILGAHLFSVLFYFPYKVHDDPWYLFRVWEDVSSFGGMLGGMATGLLFFAIRHPDLDWRGRLAHLDAIAFVFPAALAIGRFGCALAHDHPGVVTTFPLAVSLKTEAARAYIAGVYDAAGASLPSAEPMMGFHDLGLYEFLFLSLVIAPAFVHWSRYPRPAGFYLVAFATLYFPVRFGLDILRVGDPRYVGLTPAQWGAALVMAALPFAAVRCRKLRLAISAAVILATACACWGGS
jgi:phosphatidylglycerol---prolipoprotein diacylglyceryl transferase